MGYVKVNKTFVYGDFFVSKKRDPLPPRGDRPFAIEILREFSTTELIGKLYFRAGGSWVAATRDALMNFEWYRMKVLLASGAAAGSQVKNRRDALELLGKIPPRFLFFAMEGSGIWHVQNIRDESDDSGPYIAVALKFGDAPA